MSGNLTQAIANLVAAEQHIAGLTGLPPAAQQLQSQFPAQIDLAVDYAKQVQHLSMDFATIAGPKLTRIETEISSGEQKSVIHISVADVQKQASDTQDAVGILVTKLKPVSTEIFGYFNQLASIESDLTAQMTKLQGQLGDAQSEEDAAKKKYYYLLALGPLGLAGLAVALALYLKWQSEVNDWQSKIAALNAQIAAFQSMKTATQLLGSGLQSVVTKLSGLTNSVGFLASDVLAINTDLDEGDSLEIVMIATKAAATEVATLAVDAS